MSKTSQELTSYIHRILETLNHSYKELDTKTQELLEQSGLSAMDKVHLEWGLTHLHTSLMEFERDLKRHVEILKKDKDAD